MSDWFCIYTMSSWQFGWKVWDTRMTSPQKCVDIWVIPFIGIRIGLKRCNCQLCKDERHGTW